MKASVWQGWADISDSKFDYALAASIAMLHSIQGLAKDNRKEASRQLDDMRTRTTKEVACYQTPSRLSSIRA